MKNRVTTRIEKNDQTKIEALIKQEYPKYRNVSEVVRAALNDFLNNASKGGH